MDTNYTNATQQQVFCTSCGKPINAGATFCPFCGQSQNVSGAAPAGNVQMNQSPQPQAVQNPGGPVTINNIGYTPQEMTVGRWMLTMIVTSIPVVGMIMLIVWALSSSPDNRSRKNWAIAQFVWVLVLIVIVLVFGGGALTQFLGAF